MDVSLLVCKDCNKTFETKYHYSRHVANKSMCQTKIFVNEHDPKDKLQCKYCLKKYKNQYSFDRHLTNVNGACFQKQMLEQNTYRQTKLEQHLKAIEYKIDTIKTPLKAINAPIQMINQTNQILFVKPGKEKIDHITKDIILQLLDTHSFTTFCTDLMRLVYFNKNVPQNSNWCIAYPKNGKAGVVFNYDTNQF
jgi:hypothetical protein